MSVNKDEHLCQLFPLSFFFFAQMRQIYKMLFKPKPVHYFGVDYNDDKTQKNERHTSPWRYNAEESYKEFKNNNNICRVYFAIFSKRSYF